MRQENRIEEVDVLRGIAAVLMILGHSFIVYPVDISGVWWCKALRHFIYTFHMELFFVLAGVVYRCRNYNTYISKKIKRILVPYLFFGISAMLCRAFGGVLVNGVEPVGEGISKLLFHGGGYWFLYVLFLLLAFYPFMEKILNQTWKKAAFAVIMLVLSMVIELPRIFMLSTCIYYIPYFIFGDCMKQKIGGGGAKAQPDICWDFGPDYVLCN